MMYILWVDELNVKDIYKLFFGIVVFWLIVFVIMCLFINGVVNVVFFSFYNVIFVDLLFFVIFVNCVDGRQKDIVRNVIVYWEFVVYVSDEFIIEDINKMVVRFDFDVSEFGMIDFFVIDSVCISVFGIKEVKVRFECIFECYFLF